MTTKRRKCKYGRKKTKRRGCKKKSGPRRKKSKSRRKKSKSRRRKKSKSRRRRKKSKSKSRRRRKRRHRLDIKETTYCKGLYNPKIGNDGNKLKPNPVDYKRCLYENINDYEQGITTGKTGSRPSGTIDRQKGFERLYNIFKIGSQTGAAIATGGGSAAAAAWDFDVISKTPISTLFDISSQNEKLLMFTKLKLNEVLTNHLTIGYFIMSFLNDVQSNDKRRTISDTLYGKINRYMTRSLEVIPNLLTYIHHNLLEYVETRSQYFLRMTEILLQLTSYNCTDDEKGNCADGGGSGCDPANPCNPNTGKNNKLFKLLVKNFYMLISIFYKGICRFDKRKRNQIRKKDVRSYLKYFDPTGSFRPSKDELKIIIKDQKGKNVGKLSDDEYEREIKNINRKVFDLYKRNDIEQGKGDEWELVDDKMWNGRNKRQVHKYLLSMLRIMINKYKLTTDGALMNQIDYTETLERFKGSNVGFGISKKVKVEVKKSIEEVINNNFIENFVKELAVEELNVKSLYGLWRGIVEVTNDEKQPTDTLIKENYMSWIYTNINNMLDDLAFDLKLYNDADYFKQLITNVHKFHLLGWSRGLKKFWNKLAPDSIKTELESDTNSLVFRFMDLNTYMTLLPEEWRFSTTKEPNFSFLRKVSRDSSIGIDEKIDNKWLLPPAYDYDEDYRSNLDNKEIERAERAEKDAEVAAATAPTLQTIQAELEGAIKTERANDLAAFKSTIKTERDAELAAFKTLLEEEKQWEDTLDSKNFKELTKLVKNYNKDIKSVGKTKKPSDQLKRKKAEEQFRNEYRTIFKKSLGLIEGQRPGQGLASLIIYLKGIINKYKVSLPLIFSIKKKNEIRLRIKVLEEELKMYENAFNTISTLDIKAPLPPPPPPSQPPSQTQPAGSKRRRTIT